MPQDSLPDVRNAIGGGQFYGKMSLCIQFLLYFDYLLECPRGHPYFVSEVAIELLMFIIYNFYCQHHPCSVVDLYNSLSVQFVIHVLVAKIINLNQLTELLGRKIILHE